MDIKGYRKRGKRTYRINLLFTGEEQLKLAAEIHHLSKGYPGGFNGLVRGLCKEAVETFNAERDLQESKHADAQVQVQPVPSRTINTGI
jgi:hypothetical protein